jgi:hypothetical protein
LCNLIHILIRVVDKLMTEKYQELHLPYWELRSGKIILASRYARRLHEILDANPPKKISWQQVSKNGENIPSLHPIASFTYHLVINSPRSSGHSWFISISTFAATFCVDKKTRHCINEQAKALRSQILQ